MGRASVRVGGDHGCVLEMKVTKRRESGLSHPSSGLSSHKLHMHQQQPTNTIYEWMHEFTVCICMGEVCNQRGGSG